MPTIRLIHITPELPPTIGGIADYTAILSQRLVEVTDGDIEPVLVRAGWKECNEINTEFSTKDLNGKCSADALAHAISQLAWRTKDKIVVLLQYSGYGYAKRGAPLWLLRGLKKAYRENDIPLLTMFHELYATGKPWSSAFWMSPFQRYLAARIAKLSDVVVTNRLSSLQWLKKYVDNKNPVSFQPVFSNVGEPDSFVKHEEREPYAVVFGAQGMKRRLSTNLTANHLSWLKNIGINQIIDIGSTDKALSKQNILPVEHTGFQSASSISEYLKKARFGLIDLPENCLTKSGVYSSYIAHGIPVGVLGNNTDAAPLTEGKHFINLNRTSSMPINIRTSSRNEYRWYQHNAHSKITAQTLLKLMSKVV